MSIIATTPLQSITVGEYSSRLLGDSTPNRFWDIPPGSIFPPGLRLDSATGEISGIATIPGTYSFYVRETNTVTGETSQAEFLLEILNASGGSGSGVSESTVNDLIEAALGLGKIYSGQKYWVDEDVDNNGNRILCLKIDDNGQERIISYISVP